MRNKQQKVEDFTVIFGHDEQKKRNKIDFKPDTAFSSTAIFCSVKRNEIITVEEVPPLLHHSV